MHGTDRPVANRRTDGGGAMLYAASREGRIIDRNYKGRPVSVIACK